MTFSLSLSDSGPSGPAIAAHIRGPATTATSGPPVLDLAPSNGGAFSTSSNLSGVVLVNDTLKAMLLSGRIYINLHTPAFEEGEIRGQITR